MEPEGLMPRRRSVEWHSQGEEVQIAFPLAKTASKKEARSI